MSTSNGRIETPADPALAPLRACCAAIAAAQDGAWAEGAWAIGQAAWETAWSVVTLYTQQAQLAVGWVEVAGTTVAKLADSKILDDLVETNVAVMRAQGRRALEAASSVMGQFGVDRPTITPFPIVGSASAGREDAEIPEPEDHMKISECMTRDVELADPNDTIAEAAKCMARIDTGILPVRANDRLVGIITDRDIAIRAVAEGKGPDAKVSEVMNAEVKYCFEDQEVDDVLLNMGDLQVRRMPVLNHDKRLVGIVSLGDLAANTRARPAGQALSDISRPGGQHTQMAH